jgi:hypothetical protein
METKNLLSHCEKEEQAAVRIVNIEGTAAAADIQASLRQEHKGILNLDSKREGKIASKGADVAMVVWIEKLETGNSVTVET